MIFNYSTPLFNLLSAIGFSLLSAFRTLSKCRPGLPDFSWYNIPKRGKITKLPQNIPNVHKIDQHLPLGERKKINQIAIFGLLIYLATLVSAYLLYCCQVT
jgi:hypothetical protein